MSTSNSSFYDASSASSSFVRYVICKTEKLTLFSPFPEPTYMRAPKVMRFGL